MSIRSRKDSENQQQDRLANHRSRLRANKAERLRHLQMIEDMVSYEEKALLKVLKQSSKSFLDRLFKREHITQDELYQFHSCTVIKLNTAIGMIYDLDSDLRDRLISGSWLWDTSVISKKYSSISDPYEKTLFIKDLINSIRSINILSL